MAGHAIFIGYRRDDTADVAGRLYDALAARFGKRRVFKDVDALKPGANFAADIRAVLPKCRAFLALIGPAWLEVRDASGARRLDDPADWVRQEIELALATPGLDVVPVLVNGASLPRAEDLPESLRPLVARQAAVVRRDPDFHTDVRRLVEALRQSLRTGALDLTALIPRVGAKPAKAVEPANEELPVAPPPAPEPPPEPAPDKPKFKLPIALPALKPLDRRAFTIAAGGAAGLAAAGGAAYWRLVAEPARQARLAAARADEQARRIAEAWAAARGSGSRKAVRAFIEAHPASVEAQAARAMLPSIPYRFVLERQLDVGVVPDRMIASNDGALLGFLSSQTAQLWRLSDGSRLHNQGKPSSSNSGGLSVSGGRIFFEYLTGEYSSYLSRNIYAVAMGPPGSTRTLPAREGPLHFAAIGPWGFRARYAFTAYSEPWGSGENRQRLELRLENLETGEVGPVLALRSEDESINTISWAPNSIGFAIANGNRLILARPPFDGPKVVLTFGDTPSIGEFSPDGSLIAVNNTIIDSLSSQTISTIEKAFLGRFSPDGRRFVVPGDRPRLHDVATGALVRDFPTQTARRGADVAVAQDGRTVLTRHGERRSRANEPSDHLIRLWNTETGDAIGEVGPIEKGLDDLFTYQGRTLKAVFVDQGRSVLTVSDCQLALWDSQSCLQVGEIASLAPSPVQRVVLDEPRGRIITAHADNAIRIWRIEET